MPAASMLSWRRGEVGYAPDPVDDPADGDVLICCSQPRGDVALDL
jgi:hypothetical protein